MNAPSETFTRSGQPGIAPKTLRIPAPGTLLIGALVLANIAIWVATLLLFQGSPTLLGVARGLTGGLFGAAYPASLIYLGDTVPAAVRQRDVARLMVGVALGTALASVSAGIVADLLSWRLMFVLTGSTQVDVWSAKSLSVNRPPTVSDSLTSSSAIGPR